MAKEQSGIKERTKFEFREPPKYKVTLHNDDITTMEFVVQLLITVFLKTEAEATALMLTVHHKGKAVVGVYTYDIARSKTAKALKMAQDAGFPLRVTFSPE